MTAGRPDRACGGGSPVPRRCDIVGEEPNLTALGDKTDFARPTGDAEVPRGGADEDVSVVSRGCLPTHGFP